MSELGEDKKTAPRYIKVHERDNVAIIVNQGGLEAGAEFPCGTKLVEYVPQGHKMALIDLEKEDEIIRYGEVIGYANQPIPQGSWVRESLVRMPDPPPLDALVESYNPVNSSSFSPLEGMTFEGYLNQDGSVGTKNILGITTSVQCVVGVLDVAVRRIKEQLLPKYSNVDDVVAFHHNYGCGVAIDAPDAVIPIRTIQNLAIHPNFGGESLVLGLGCEKLSTSRLDPDKEQSNTVLLQEHQGFHNMIEAIMKLAEERLKTLNERKRVSVPLSKLVVGLQCGGSDAFSGVTANPAVGYAADLLVRAGATVMLSEVTEVRDAVHLLTARAANASVVQHLVREMHWYDEYLRKGGADRSANTTPGNKTGGLVNIVEKSLGSIVKSGTTPIMGVLGPGEKASQDQTGLLFAATPASDFVCGTLQLASGMHLQVFTTGRGTPYGLSAAPVIKVSSRTGLKQQWDDLIDVDAGTIASGDATIEEVGMEIFKTIIEVSSGRQTTMSDRWGLHNDICLFNPAPLT